MFRAPQWHGAIQTHFPPRPRKSAWHCDITNFISPHGLPTHYKQSYHTIRPCFALPSGTAPRKRTFHQGRANPHGTATSRTSFRHTVCPHTRSNHITRYCQSSRSPATRRGYTSMFRAPQWHGATQTHFPTRPRKSAWRCDITNVIRHTFCPHATCNPITRYRQSSRSPATRRVYNSMFRAPQWHGATQTHFPPRPRKSAWHCDITNTSFRHTVCPHTTSNHITRYGHVSRSPVARRHANALPAKTSQIRMALRHHERNSPHVLPTH